MAQSSPVTPGSGSPRDSVTGWVGWVLFAGILMFTAGFFNIVEGLVALLNSGYYRVQSTGLLFHVNYAAWGWALLFFGVVLALAGWGVMAGRTWARTVGVIMVVLNATVNLAFIAAYPVWITLTIALDVIVIYALIVHGREASAFRE